MRKNFVKSLLLIALIGFSPAAFSQNIAINLAGAASTQPTAILDMSDPSNNALGLVLPNVSISAFNTIAPFASTPATGLIVWNTNAAMAGGLGVGFYYWNGTQWNYLYNNGSAVGNFILNQTTAQAGANFNIGSNGVIGGTLGVTGTSALTGATTLGKASTTNGSLIFSNSTNANTVTFNSGVTTTSYALTLPLAAPTVNGQVLSSTTAGVMSWATAAGGLTTANNGLTVTGSNLQLGGSNLVQATNIPLNGFPLSLTGSKGSPTFASTGAFGIGGAPNASAAIDLTNTMATGGTGAPVLWCSNPNPAANIAAPVLGEEIYNSTTGCFNFYNGASWVGMGCPCTTAPAAPTITASCSQSWQGSSITYTSSITVGVTFSWTVTSTVGTPTITSGQGTSSITVLWPSSGAGTGTVTLSITNLCGANVGTLSVPIDPVPSITGSTPIGLSSTGNIYTCSQAGATYAWSSNNTWGVIVGSTTGQSISVTAGSTVGTFTLTCTATFGACSITKTFVVTTTACTHLTTTFAYSGSIVTYNIPACVSSVTITAIGAAGGSSGYSAGGQGAVIVGTFAGLGGTTL